MAAARNTNRCARARVEGRATRQSTSGGDAHADYVLAALRISGACAVMTMVERVVFGRSGGAVAGVAADVPA